SASYWGMVTSSARKYSPARSAIAKLVPSAEMPKPENIGRIVTGPKSENRSIRNSRSMRRPTRRSNRGRLQLHRLAAAAGGNLVRVVEHELRLHLVGLVVHLGAEQEQHGLGVDQDLDALVLDHLVGGADLVGIFYGVGLAGAAAILDADAETHDLGIGARGQFADTRGRSIRQAHDLRAGARFRL